MSRCAAILACRAESTRLYGKPLQLVGNQSILTRIIDQIERINKVDKIVLAIADRPSQASFVRLANNNDLEHVIGSEADVLSRLIKGAEAVGADTVLRVTTENPFIHWQSVDKAISQHRTAGADITVPKRLPLGAGYQVIETESLRESHKKGTDKHRSEFCTLYIKQHPESFNINKIELPNNVQRPDIRVTVDNPCDLIFVRKIYQELKEKTEEIQIEDIVSLVEENPDLLEINSHKPDGTSEMVKEKSIAY